MFGTKSLRLVSLSVLVAMAVLLPSPASASTQGIATTSLIAGWGSERYYFALDAAVVDGRGTVVIERYLVDGAVNPFTAVQTVTSMQISVEGGKKVARLEGQCFAGAETGPCRTTLVDGGPNYQAGPPWTTYVDNWRFEWGSHHYWGVPGQGEIVVEPR